MSWDGVLYENYPTGKPQTTVLKVTIPANTSTPWHTHPVISSAYVLSGELTMERKSAKGEKGTERKIIKAGEVLPEMVGVPHHSITGNSPVVLIVFYAGSKGIPLSEAVVP
jgi:quercetin dioxygenase-like cupin family protein